VLSSSTGILTCFAVCVLEEYQTVLARVWWRRMRFVSVEKLWRCVERMNRQLLTMTVITAVIVCPVLVSIVAVGSARL
jgi:hypothetical protein